MSEKTKKPAKIASAKGEAVIVLTRRACVHCGELIPANKMLAVRAIGNGTNRMTHYHRDHHAAA